MTQEAIKLDYIPEPELSFGFNQSYDNPREGLFAFGPIIDQRKPAEIRIGVIGTEAGIELYKTSVAILNKYIAAKEHPNRKEISFPGFEAAFKTKWPQSPVAILKVDEKDVSNRLKNKDRHKGIYDCVSLFEEAIRNHKRNDDAIVDVWFVVIPDEVHEFGKPKSKVPISERTEQGNIIDIKIGKRLLKAPSLFPEDNEAAQVYTYEKNFHNQLKARLLDCAVIQIVRHSTLEGLRLTPDLSARRGLQDAASIAWNISTTTFYKAGGRPWKLARVREKVCYIGLVFKHDDSSPNDGKACCGAQMFLDSGEGLVFKGAVGDWYKPETKEYHLTKDKACELIKTIVEAYKQDHGTYPNELFIHGKTYFNEEEWAGFQEAVPNTTSVVCVRITPSKDIKLYSSGDNAALRGSAYHYNKRKGFLWTRGFVPKLMTYQGREVPNPLAVEICRGKAELDQVMKDIMGLTKINFNACIYADGFPVTLRFADAVGEILTAAPIKDLPPLPFRYYI